MTEDAKRLTAQQLDHLLSIRREVSDRLSDQYTRGAIEHGGFLGDKTIGALLDEAIAEAIDQLVYLITTREHLIYYGDPSASKPLGVIRATSWNPDDVVDIFWQELGDSGQHPFFTKPISNGIDDNIYVMRTEGDFMFDNSFWDVFHLYPFYIYHIRIMIKGRAGCNDDSGVFELRFGVNHVTESPGR